MTEQVMTYGENIEQEKPLQRWVKRIWNVIPSRKAIWNAIKYCGKNLFKKTRTIFVKELKEAGRDLKEFLSKFAAFSTYNIKTPQSKATDCPLDEMPIIVKVESIGGKGRHFHAGMAYGEVAIDSNGAGQNGPKNGKMDAPLDTEGSYFILYPSKLGLDKDKLLAAMKEEAAKTNDYDFWMDNCIDHVVRPLKKAGANIDFDKFIAIPKDLCKWCDEACYKQKAGFVLNEEGYKNLLTRIEENGRNEAGQTGNIDFLYIVNSLRKMITKIQTPDNTQSVQNPITETEKSTSSQPTKKVLPLKDGRNY